MFYIDFFVFSLVMDFLVVIGFVGVGVMVLLFYRVMGVEYKVRVRLFCLF